MRKDLRVHVLLGSSGWTGAERSNMPIIDVALDAECVSVGRRVASVRFGSEANATCRVVNRSARVVEVCGSNGDTLVQASRLVHGYRVDTAYLRERNILPSALDVTGHYVPLLLLIVPSDRCDNCRVMTVLTVGSDWIDFIVPGDIDAWRGSGMAGSEASIATSVVGDLTAAAPKPIEPTLTRELPGYEVEAKLRLLAENVSLADVLAQLRTEAELSRLGTLDAWMTWPPIEAREFTVDMFDISARAETGYISCVRSTDGTLILKRKWATGSVAVRRESLQELPSLTEDIETHLRTLLPTDCEISRLPQAFRRRYKTKVRSLDTGRIFNVIADEYCTASAGGVPLRQIEVEYSATIAAASVPKWCPSVEEDVITTCSAIEHWCSANGLGVVPDFSSKADYLRALHVRV